MSESQTSTALDIVIPVYNEGGNIVSVLDSLRRHVKTPYRVLICYDYDDDDTLPAIAAYPPDDGEIVLVKNPDAGPNQAVAAGLAASTAPAVLVHMADDDYNAPVIDAMVERLHRGCDVVAGSRYVRGGQYEGAYWLKQALSWTASFTLYHLGGVPVQDATNGFRLFSRRLLDAIQIESRKGFTFTIELLVKADRLGLRIEEVPVTWFERKVGKSRFRILGWILPYLRWYLFGLATAWLRRGPETVALRDGVTLEDLRA